MLSTPAILAWSMSLTVLIIFLFTRLPTFPFKWDPSVSADVIICRVWLANSSVCLLSRLCHWLIVRTAWSAECWKCCFTLSRATRAQLSSLTRSARSERSWSRYFHHCVRVHMCVRMSFYSYEGPWLWGHFGWSSQIQRAFWGTCFLG